MDEVEVDDLPEPVEPKQLATVYSVRLPSNIAAMLRDVANRRGCSVSDLMREGVGHVLCIEGLCTCPGCPRRDRSDGRHG
jgi:hypothetical protein